MIGREAYQRGTAAAGYEEDEQVAEKGFEAALRAPRAQMQGAAT